MNESTTNEWNFFYRRILIKDMRCGLSEKTINNVAKANKYNDYLIPVFACQLSQDCELHRKKLIGEKVLQHLKEINEVAYLRYASVYKEFSDVSDFEKEVAEFN